jgi:hypothetical protein
VAVTTVLRADKTVAAVAVNAVIAELTVEVIEAIDTRFVLLEAIPVHAILAEVCMHDEVAVLGRTSKMNVVAVHECPLHVESEGRHTRFQSSELIEEGMREVDLLAVGAWIPPIAVPALPTVDRE